MPSSLSLAPCTNTSARGKSTDTLPRCYGFFCPGVEDPGSGSPFFVTCPQNRQIKRLSTSGLGRCALGLIEHRPVHLPPGAEGFAIGSASPEKSTPRQQGCLNRIPRI